MNVAEPSQNAYEILEVDSAASFAEIKSAYRRKLRIVHPDTGGSPEAFRRVVEAWENLSTPAARQAYDDALALKAFSKKQTPIFPQAPRAKASSGSPKGRTRSFGHPGGYMRQCYLNALGEWLGRGEPLANPYSPDLLARIPNDIRALYHKAKAEESTVKCLIELGGNFSLWSDLAIAKRPGQKIDHILATPLGVFAIHSIDWQGQISLKKGDILLDGVKVPGNFFSTLWSDLHLWEKDTKVMFDGLILVAPTRDVGALNERVQKRKYAQTHLVARFHLADFVESAQGEKKKSKSYDIFEVRQSVNQHAIFL